MISALGTIWFVFLLLVPTNSFVLVSRHHSFSAQSRTQIPLCAKPLEETTAKQMANVCKFCGGEFDSRNAVFRHLRSSKSCYDLAQYQSKGGQSKGNVVDFLKLKKRKVAVQFGYHISDNDSITCGNEVAAGVLCGAFFQALRALYPSSPVEEEEGETTFTLASAAQLRHPSLMQENTCSAWSDVVGINYKGGPDDIDINSLLNQMQDIIADGVTQDDDDGVLCIKVLNVESLTVSTKFHAEKSCSQRSYQFLMPIKWLDDSQETQEWIRNKAGADTGHQIQTSRTPTPSSLVKFKKALKLAESRDVTQISSPAVSSAGRFGKLWQKERRPFHNFCDPSLGSGGMASPSNENVWRSVDKARLSGFIIDDKNENEALVVIEFRGDGFVAQQIRRMIASVIAISNGWIPPEFLSDVATRSDVSIETPIAPSGLLYFSSPRFHFVDLVQGSSLFETKDGNNRNENWLGSLQSALLHARAQKVEEESTWLDELRNIASPRIRSALEQIALDDTLKEEQIQRKKEEHKSEDSIEKEVDFSVTPEVYHQTLSLLQDICGRGKWPMTSDARSRVIRAPVGNPNEGNLRERPDLKSRAASSQFKGHLVQCGSFTIVNPQSFQGQLPTVNKQFPELVDAIFELEAYHSSENSRSCLNDIPGNGSVALASTHCTVNRNIEFTPHFDNGKGQEHSHSMIVGLGDYAGGEFVVDGKSYSIRYDVLKFDGWKQIHSTTRFRGERFSLVWFTPERREDYIPKGDTSFEDAKANSLVQAHALSLLSYPLLNFRHNSTDALVINEILDTDQGCTYELSQRSWCSMIKQSSDTEEAQHGFSLKGHEAVLDIGAHIGVFCRYALSAGCKNVIAYEPESENLKLLEQNLKCSHSADNKAEDRVKIYQCAVAHGEPGLQNFVLARNRTDGSLNTWRHSLEKHSNYVDKKGTKLFSKGQDALLARSQVQTVPFFGDGGALLPGITFVKMDCEGAEVDILLSPESSHSSNWLDVKNLVFEWSFTKERRVQTFHTAVQNLESAGFNVVYEGQGSWWDTEPNCMWPYHSDLVVFARMRK
jgi:FkbM family methyltransferase